MGNHGNLRIRFGSSCVVVLLIVLTCDLCSRAQQGLTQGIPDPGIIKSEQDGCYYIFSAGGATGPLG